MAPELKSDKKKFQTFIGEFLSGCNMSNTITSSESFKFLNDMFKPSNNLLGPDCFRDSRDSSK